MDTNNIKDWIERLQQESWNLELLVSGFSILLLIQAKDQLVKLLEYINLHYAFSDEIFSMLYTALGAITLGCIALVICLTIHILLRGFWIGTIGLRSVQPKVDFKKLRYAPAFQQQLEKNLPTLDRSLIRLDQVSSAIFSFAFLIIFMLLSLVAWFGVLTLFLLVRNFVYDLFETETWLSETIFTFFTLGALFVVFLGLIYLIDTLSGGILKRIKWFKSRPYIWVYRLMATITLSFLYRSIYYHLISYLGVWPSRFLLSGFLFSMVFLPFLRLDHEIYFPDLSPENKVLSYYYDDIRADDEIIKSVAIPSSIIASKYLPIFTRYSPARNQTIAHLCPDYQPSRKSGFSSGIHINQDRFGLEDPTVKEANADSLLACLTSIYTVKIDDSTYQDLQYYYMEHPNRGEKGIFTTLNIENLAPGHHLLRVSYQKWYEYQDTVVTKNWVSIPFWKE